MISIETFEKAKAEGCAFLDEFVFKHGSEMSATEFYPILRNAIGQFLRSVGLHHRTEYIDITGANPTFENGILEQPRDHNCMIGVGHYGEVVHKKLDGTEVCAFYTYTFEISPDCLTLRFTGTSGDYKNAWFASDRYQFEEMFADFTERVRLTVERMNRNDEVLTVIA